MSNPIRPASPASAFRKPSDDDRAAVELPVSRDAEGRPLVVHVRRLERSELIRAQARLATLGGFQTHDAQEMAENMEASERVFADLARLAVVAPRFAFDGDPLDDLPAFADLPWLDKQAIAAGAQALGGLAEMPERVRLFRDGALPGPADVDARGPAGPDEPGAAGSANLP